MQRWLVICGALLALVGADECPDGGRCVGGQTCCNNPGNGYECCPFNQAECCGDHMHCCPAGTVCDTVSSSCLNSTGSIPWAKRVSADKPKLSKSFRMIKTNMGEEDDNICPDQSRCPPEFSCLRALTKFGCCPLAQGVPCSDGKHCCPEGHQCSVDSRSCIKKEHVTAIVCKDGVSECPDETTCCETEEGKWGCCPMPKAVCCEDKIHCCPEGSSCDVEHSKCISSSTRKVTPMWSKLPARIRADWENQKESEQVTAKTVVNSGSQKSPEVTTVFSVPTTEKEASVSSVSKAAAAEMHESNDVPCDETSACPDNTTCCKTETGDWGCCPFPEAVCCEDFIHCCPHGKKCNLAAGTCDDDTCSVPWVKKVPAIPRQVVKVRDVECDSTHSCADDTTCCKTETGDWACCPLPEAVCCEDHLHCCPHGKTCNLAAQTCDDDRYSVPWVKKVPAIPRQVAKVRDVACDSTYSCADDTTCCKTKTGDWACCPLPKAVCCDDHEHCCPADTTCDLATLSCVSTSGSTSMKRKIPAFSTAAPTTVAAITQSQAKQTGQEKEPEKEAMKALKTDEDEDDEDEDDEDEDDDEQEEKNEKVKDKRCDANTTCPQFSTCCFMKSSQKWGCCPLKEAVCCADGEHCCPAHYKCSESKNSCVKGEVMIPWYTKLPATKSTEADTSSVQCNRLRLCPNFTTCCRLESGKWGCCPLPNAVCCPDKEHCCPKGYTCNNSSKSCQKVILLEVESVPLTPVYLLDEQPPLSPSKHRDIKCDDETSCTDEETCCRTSATSWGCCPSPNAVCCSDMKHCCPTGYTCTEGGDCFKTTSLHWFNWHVSLPSKRRAMIV